MPSVRRGPLSVDELRMPWDGPAKPSPPAKTGSRHSYQHTGMGQSFSPASAKASSTSQPGRRQQRPEVC